MCESVNRKQKRQNSALTSKTVKGIFKKDDLDDSLSTSEWGLDLNDSYKSKKRNNYVKLEEEPLTLICEWNNCCQAFTEFVPYNSHLQQHLEDCILEEETSRCCWTDCSYIAYSAISLKQHLCYHGYHTKLKSVGKNVEVRAKLPNCTQTDPFVIPEMTDGYHCEWEYCYYKFDTIFDFFEHVRIHVFHNPSGCKEGVINCCWKGCTSAGNFRSQYKLSEHLRVHTKEKIIACPTCGNLFSSKTKFCDHRRRQMPINLQSYLCSQCSKFFPSERLLRDHMRLHINHYKCSMCEMTCPKPSILAKHIRYKHSTEKPYKCNQCDYRCVSKHNLVFHLKKHESECQFQCSECDYECRSAFGLERHNQTRHGKELSNIYECHNCKKRFIRGGLLTKHLMKVHNYHWPSGHSRFRYKEDQDGIYRLQTVRYETLDVTEEIIKGKKVQAPSDKVSFKFDLVKQEKVDENAVDAFEVICARVEENETKVEPSKKVVIQIDDIDAKGNILKSQTIQSSEVICSDITEITSDVDDTDKIIIVKSTKKGGKRRGSKRKRRS